jgi:hypothetical protein
MKKLITYLSTAALLLSMGIFVSCDKTDELPPIDGYNNSNEVASANLVAHWPFDDNNNERISGTASSATFGTVTTTTGKIGKALQLNKGAVVYPSITALNSANSLANYSISMWVNVNNNKGTTSEGFTPFFALAPTAVTAEWPDVLAAAETGWYTAAKDTLILKGYFKSHTSTGENNQDNIALPGNSNGQYVKGAGRWVHFVSQWNSSTNMFLIYADGVSVGGYNLRGSNPVGALILSPPLKAIFGSMPSKDIGFTSGVSQPSWSPWATAGIDDVRIYNSVLTQAEVTALYNLGTAGR